MQKMIMRHWRIWSLVLGVLLCLSTTASAITTGQATIHTAATGNTNTSNCPTCFVDVKGFTTLTVQVCCTFDATVSFLASVDGINYDAIGCAPIQTNSGYVDNTIARGIFRCNLIAINNRFRADISNYVSGTIRVTVSMTAAGVT